MTTTPSSPAKTAQIRVGVLNATECTGKPEYLVKRQINDDGARELAMAIVIQAVEDWRKLREAGVDTLSTDGGKIALWEIKRFLKGKFCGVLLGSTDITGSDILKRLEAED